VQGWTEYKLRWRSRRANDPPYRRAKVRFTLQYTLHGAVWRYWRVDELYWKAIFEDREGSVRRGRCLVKLPASPEQFAVTFYCRSPDARWVKHEDPPAVEFTAGNVAPGQRFEVRIRMPKGVISGGGSLADLMAGGLGVVVLLGGALLAGLITWWRWRRFGRDPQPTALPAYLDRPPDDLNPALAAALVNETADIRAVTATMMDLARRGVLTIEELGEDGSSDYAFTLNRFDPEALDPLERSLLAGIFGETTRFGTTVPASALRNKFYRTAGRVQKEAWRQVTEQGFFDGRPRRVILKNALAGVALCVAGLVLITFSRPEAGFLCLWGSLFGGGPGIFVGRAVRSGASLLRGVLKSLFLLVFVVIGLAVFCGGLIVAWGQGVRPLLHFPGFVLLLAGLATILTARLMVRKSQRGADAAAGWKAFAEFLGSRGTLDVSTPGQQFGDYLPYAVALGLERNWAQRFDGLAQPPELPYYDPYRLRRDHDSPTAAPLGNFSDTIGAGIAAMVSSVSSTFASSPSSSGSSGGGSSGGGGGGGGGSGGGW
jgi:uncharacterized membrane protein YgcG